MEPIRKQAWGWVSTLSLVKICGYCKGHGKARGPMVDHLVPECKLEPRFLRHPKWGGGGGAFGRKIPYELAQNVMLTPAQKEKYTPKGEIHQKEKYTAPHRMVDVFLVSPPAKLQSLNTTHSKVPRSDRLTWPWQNKMEPWRIGSSPV